MKRFLFKYKKLILGLLLTLSFMVLMIAPVLAQEEETPVKFEPQVTIPGSVFKSGGSVLLEHNTAPIAKYISAIYNYGVSIVGILASLMLMIGGIIWLTAAGSSSKIEQAKEFIFSSLTGMALLLVAVVLLRTVNPALVEFRNPTLTTIDKVEPCCNTLRGPTFEVTVKQTPERLIYNCAPAKERDTHPDGTKAQVNKCTGKAKCQIGPESTPTNPTYGCIDPDNFTCCEYMAPSPTADDDSVINCVSIQPANNETCPATLGGISKTSEREKYYCQKGSFIGKTVNGCKLDCIGEEKGHLCSGVYSGARCYGTDGDLTCRLGSVRQAMGDVCGNTDAETRCMPGGFGGSFYDVVNDIATAEAHCDDSDCLSHDKTWSSGESCGDDLACCYYDPSDGYEAACREKEELKKWFPKETGTAN